MPKTDHQTAIEKSLCERDYHLLEEHHLGLLIDIEQAVNDGCTPQEIRRWAQNVTGEEIILQRVFNAARWLVA